MHRFVHLDSTTFSLHGAYEAEEGEGEGTEVVSITKGFSKDHAPELNQVVLSMMTTYGSSISVWLEALSGNANDKVSFRKSISEYRRQFKAEGAHSRLRAQSDGRLWEWVPHTIGAKHLW